MKPLAAEPHILTTDAQLVLPTRPAAPQQWREALRTAVRSPAELCKLLGLPAKIAANAGDFPLLVPKGFVERMQPGDPHDPLLRQVLPVAAEHETVPGFVADPVGDLAATRGPGLLHKYQGRVLLVLTGACAVNCRYCFRRHYPYETESTGFRQLDPAIKQIASDTAIDEVILSGGDPLMLGDEQLAELIEKLGNIPHLRRLRIHTRLPIVIADRVTDELCQMLQATHLQSVVVVHSNHANEIDHRVAHAFARLKSAGVMLLNQAVLLRGVNDSVAALKNLSERLLETGAMPYYLHQLDRAAGTAHFEVPVAEGKQLIEQLRTQLPGYAVPRYVRELEGDPNKRVLA